MSKNGAESSREMHESPAVGAKCVKSSGSSFSTGSRPIQRIIFSLLIQSNLVFVIGMQLASVEWNIKTQREGIYFFSE